VITAKAVPGAGSAPTVEQLVISVLTECLHQRGLGPERSDLDLLGRLLGELADRDPGTAVSTLIGMLTTALELLGELEGRDPLELVRGMWMAQPGAFCVAEGP